MKSFDTKLNPVTGLFILGAAVPAAVYLIGLITFLFWVGVGLLFRGIIDGPFSNVMTIITLVLQCVMVMILTVLLTVFSNFKAKHVLLSLPVTAALFFLGERFFLGNALNYLVESAFLEKLYEYIGLDNTNGETYLETRLYLITTLLFTAGSAAIVLTTWVITRSAAKKERQKKELR